MEFIHSNVNLTVPPQCEPYSLIGNLTVLKNVSNSGGEDEDLPYKISSNDYLFSLSTVIILALLMGMLSLITVLGNTLVILAFIMDKNLRNLSCYFLLNLAVCDFLVGSFSIPWTIPYILTGRWSTGRGGCKFWLVLDSTVCISSVYSILLISHDRFLSVTKAISYRVLQGTNNVIRNALSKIGTAWGVAFLLSAPPILFWDIATGSSDVAEGSCTLEFVNAWYFLICLSTIDFYLPLISVIYFNLSIYWNIKKQSHKIQNLNLPRNKEQATVFFIPEKNEPVEDQPLSPYFVEERQKSLLMERTQNQTLFTGETNKPDNMVSSESTLSIRQQNNAINPNSTRHSKIEKDKKIAKSLGIIVVLNQSLMDKATSSTSAQEGKIIDKDVFTRQTYWNQ
ncbi:histamine H3 receptor-like [Rhinatrema bivittatum]|uniref:histamine H3 receptor-like n=1 Tax=Rhinatrema bivittatum TaxID=194408 RepID=UPI00112BE61D|nr:histamine H3 receptor-like [Rhinatrema bivittatum]